MNSEPLKISSATQSRKAKEQHEMKQPIDTTTVLIERLMTLTGSGKVSWQEQFKDEAYYVDLDAYSGIILMYVGGVSPVSDQFEIGFYGRGYAYSDSVIVRPGEKNFERLKILFRTIQGKRKENKGVRQALFQLSSL